MSKLVSAVMLTSTRQKFAKLALESFLAQSYQNKELVIVHNGDSDQPDSKRALWRHWMCPASQVREIFVRGSYTIGELRNVGLEAAKGDWIVQFDDDDWSHPLRIEQQLARSGRSGKAVLFSHRIHFSTVFQTAFVSIHPMGCVGCAIVPKSSGRYASLNSAEDTDFMRSCYSDAIVWDNKDFPHIFLRSHHDSNLCSTRFIMGRYTKPKPVKADGFHMYAMPPQAASYTKDLLDSKYLGI